MLNGIILDISFYYLYFAYLKFDDVYRIYLSLVFFLSSFVLKAQTLRPKVFIVGNNIACFAAAIQSAESNVETLWLLNGESIDIEPYSLGFHSGIASRLLNKIKQENKRLGNTDTLKYNARLLNAITQNWTDSLKGKLKIIKKQTWFKASRSGKNWVFKLTDKSTIRPEVLILSSDTELVKVLKIDSSLYGLSTKYQPDNVLYKTSVAIDNTYETEIKYISMYQMIDPKEDNLVYINNTESFGVGQAAGAIAAFAGFFGINTSEVNLRKVQAELLNFKSSLLVFADVAPEDKQWKDIQMLGLTGVLKPIDKNGQWYFMPDSIVKTNEIRSALKAHFYKAQIWFEDHKNENLSIGEALKMVCYLGNKALEQTQSEVEKKWNKAYGFQQKFDTAKTISRRELAVLLIEYCSPFVVSLNKEGQIVR